MGPMMMTVVVMRLSERRGRKQQHQGKDNQFLHAEIVTRTDYSASVEITAGTSSVSPRETQGKPQTAASKAA
jgi:hypothetical protein